MKRIKHSMQSQVCSLELGRSNRQARVAGSLALTTVLALSTGTAAAVEVPRYDFQGASGVCQASAPQYEANLRARPLGLSNIGTTPAFVTCAIQGSDPTGQVGAYQVQVNIANNNATAKVMACTLVVVYRLSGETVDKTAYRTRTISVPGGMGVFLSWVPTDLTGTFGGPEISKSGVSCTLPAKTTLQYTGNYYFEEVGA